MTKIQGMELDLEKSSDGTSGDMWKLVFTQGLFEGPGVSKTTEPVQFIIKKKDYNHPLPVGYYIYYNPYYNKFQITTDNPEECTDPGYNIGGFLVSNCRMIFLNPKCTDDTSYIRPFAEEFDQNFEKRKISCDEMDDFCGAFRDGGEDGDPDGIPGFSSGFEIDCPIIEDNNSFYYAEFDPDEFETLPNP